ncbi:MAG: sigma-70 family RNA polymerase sigma factor [bacterium]|nr:sigma-70 family RNA polymerase sigma factor [bacterium]
MELEAPESLLDHGQLLRRLAGALLRSTADVDDVVQGAYTAALTQQRPSGWPLPQWLAGVGRNLSRRQLRDRQRRVSAENAAARPDTTRSTVEVIEREELRSLVVDAVMALPDPQRSVVLMRYYDGVPPREIARRLDMPGATVRSHLHRALETLRARLDRDHPRGRAGWTALLLPLAVADSVAPPVGAAKAFTVGFVAVSVLAMGILAWWLGSTPLEVDRAATVRAADREPVITQTAEAPLDRTAADTTAPVAPPANEPAPKAAVVVRFLDAERQPVAGDAMRDQFRAARGAGAALLIDAAALERGGIEALIAARFGPTEVWQQNLPLEFSEDGASISAPAGTGRFRLLVPRPHAAGYLSTPFELPSAEPLCIEVPLAPPVERRIVHFVAADTGAPLADATVTAYTEFGDDRAFLPGSVMKTDASGDCTIATVELGGSQVIRNAVWWLETPDYAGRFSIGEPGDVLEVQVPKRGVITGMAYSSAGAAAAGEQIAFACNKGPAFSAEVGADGRFVIPRVPAARGTLALVGGPGVRATPVSVSPGKTIEAVIGSVMVGASVVGRITTGGQPLAGVMTMAGSRSKDRRFAKTAADGSFTLSDVASKARFAILLGDPAVSDNFTIQRSEPLDLSGGKQPALDFDLPAGMLRVQVVDASDGKPIAGVPVTAGPKNRNSQRDRFPGYTYRAGWAERTNADGEVTMRCLPMGEAHSLRVRAHRSGYESVTVDVLEPHVRISDGPLVIRLNQK